MNGPVVIGAEVVEEKMSVVSLVKVLLEDSTVELGALELLAISVLEDEDSTVEVLLGSLELVVLDISVVEDEVLETAVDEVLETAADEVLETATEEVEDVEVVVDEATVLLDVLETGFGLR